MRNWMIPAISWARPPNVSATAKTTGRMAAGTRLAFHMLSMKVVVAKPARASGPEFPQATPVAEAGFATGVAGWMRCSAVAT